MANPQPPNGTVDRDRWFKALAETIDTPIFLMRQSVLFANPAATTLTGYTVEELQQLPTAELVHPDQRDETVMRFRERLMGHAVPSHYNMKVLCKDGSVRWIDYSATTMEFENETVVLATAFDITQRKLAEQALRNSEARLRLTLDQLPAVLWTVDRDLRLASSQGAGMAHLGLPESGLEGLTLFDYFQTEDPEFPAIDAHRRALEGESVTFEQEWLGSHFQSRVDPLRDDKAEIIGAIGLSLDISERIIAERALRDSEARLRLAQRAGRSVTWEWDIDSNRLEVSEDASELFGIPPEKLQTDFDDFFEQFGPHARELMRQAVRRTLEDDVNLDVELPVTMPDGEVRWLSQRGRAVQQKENHTRLLGVATDITELRRASDALFQEKERAQVTLASIADGVIRTDSDGRVDFLNPVAAQLTGWQREEAVHQPVARIYRTVDEDSGEVLPDQVASCLREQRIVPMAGRRLLVRRDGMRFAIRDSVARIRDRSGNIVGAVLVFQDVTELRGMEQRMERMASHDPLTDLINRGEFEKRLEAALASTQSRPELEHVLGYLDLDEFKLVNDTCGHTAGDELLKQLKTLICTEMEGRGLVARLGGDEFGLLFESCSISEAREVSERIRAEIREHRFTWNGRIFDSSVSLGLVPISNESRSVAELMSAADGACYVAKDHGRNRIHAYRPGDQALAQRYGEMQWVHHIHKAFEEDRFRLYHQPIQPLSNGHRHLSEIFIRMIGEDGELVSPAKFIPAAERYHLISTIDRWVVRTALQTLPHLDPNSGGPNLDQTVFNINLSGQSIGEESFLEEVLNELEASTVDPERICFEITETAAIGNLVAANRFFHAVREKGCRFVLDDFGSGLSSFAYLKNLPVDFLKIDGEFVRNVGRDPVQRVLVESIQRIGEVMGIHTIGECVETEAAYRVLQEIGIDYAQGFWIARPTPLR